ncbi:hypothetical protein EUX98_g4276 [Antrodiella citrinella]|uniref:BTB domain-containing protein n=1 Tax=Antrodiella citrinella TaxID=2447956 RepID=A0A4S4MWX6_9APHY|nr:hypothetical protein EUX98_g4276 [Antrodiella citrinella]
MFLIPQPEEFEQIDGCPVVHLADSRRDLGVLLGTLYEAHKYFKSEHLLTFPDVSAMLRMGTKYQVDHVREEAISRLRLCFPSTLHTFPARNVYLQDPGFVLAEHISLTKKDAIGVVNLARAFDLDFLLPPAFYLCAQLDYDELVDGVEDACVPGARPPQRARLEGVHQGADAPHEGGRAEPAAAVLPRREPRVRICVAVRGREEGAGAGAVV